MYKFSLFLFVVFTTFLSAKDDPNQKYIDSLESSFKYEHGTIKLKNGIGEIKIPEGFKYLSADQANRVLKDIWGNPNEGNTSLGFIMPENQTILDENGYVFNIEYDEIGYVKDDDADDIDYNELLEEMRKDCVTENAERVKSGYPTINIVGWASTPFYDKNRKILHWAKEIKFDKDSINTLNYNVRILGRKGVIILNAISTMRELPLVKKDISKVLNIVQFNDDLKYEKFDSSVDDIAAWSIGGLVAGKVLAKVGFFALILEFWKVILVAVLAIFGGLRKKIFGDKN